MLVLMRLCVCVCVCVVANALLPLQRRVDIEPGPGVAFLALSAFCVSSCAALEDYGQQQRCVCIRASYCMLGRECLCGGRGGIFPLSACAAMVYPLPKPTRQRGERMLLTKRLISYVKCAKTRVLPRGKVELAARRRSLTSCATKTRYAVVCKLVFPFPFFIGVCVCKLFT